MKKHITILSLLLMSLAPVSVQAMGKFDISKLVQKITEEAGKVQEEAGKIQKDVAQVANLNQLKDTVDEAQKMKGKLDDAKKKVGEVQSAANETQQAVSNAQNTTSDLQSATGGGAQELLGLQTELAQSQQNLKNDLQALDDEMQAEIKPLQNNNAVLQKEIDSITQQLAAQSNNQGTDFVQDNRANLQIQIDKNNAKIAEIKEKYAAKQKEKQEAFEKEKSSLNEKMDKVKSLAGNIDLNNMNAGNAQKALSGFFSSGGSSAMSATMQKNFYAEDEQDSPERNEEIDSYRKKVALDDAADVYARAVKMMSYGDKYIVAVHDLEMNAPTAETTPAGIMLEISAKVQQMKILLNYAYLSVAELKMTTAMDMVRMPKHLNNASKDPSVFNLDDYKDAKAAAEEKKKKKSGLSGLVDGAKNAANKAKELKDEYGDDVVNGIETAKEAQGFYEDATAASNSMGK